MDSPSQNLRISAAGLLLSYWCNARCAHCYELSGPDRRGWMALDDARAHLAALSRMGVPASGVHIGGGEPFGNYELLLDVVRAAQRSDLGGVGYVETNAFWATSDEVVRRRLLELRGAGMRQIAVSADVFHQAYVDPECVRRLRRVAVEVLGESGVRARRWRFLKSPRDLRTASQSERLEAYRAALAEHPERMTGRAARELAELLPRRPAEDLEAGRCRVLPGARHVHVDAFGNVFPGTCVGLLLGQAGVRIPLDRILALHRGPVWQILAERGPLGLRDTIARRLGYVDDPAGYADTCHLCAGVRAFLFRAGCCPDELGPREVYEDG